VPRRIRDYKFTSIRVEETVRYINGYALFSFGGKSIDKEREVDVPSLRALSFRVSLQRCYLVIENELCLIKQAANERALTIVN
jgi:hypothetical protein